MGQLSQACNVVTLALSVLLAGCNISLQGPAGAATPEDAARQAHAQGSGRGAFQNFTVVGTRVSGNRGVVFSTGIANSSQQITPRQMFGVDVLTKEAGGWFSRLSSSGNATFQTISPALVCGNIDTGNDQLGYYTLIYGSVRSPDVVSVEVDFRNGKTLTDKTADGLFAVFIDTQDPPVELRSLGANGRTIHSIDLSQVALPTPIPWGGMGIAESGTSMSLPCSP